MELPNYFFADLPASHVVTPQLVAEACRALKENRERFLLPRSSREIVQVIAAAGQSWLDPKNLFRQMALERGEAETGFSRQTMERGLDAFFQQLTVENLEALLVQDLGHPDRLDRFVRNSECGTRFLDSGRTAAMARGPELLVHIAAGNIPNPTLFSMIVGFLVRSAQFIKCARGTSLLPRLFAHSIYEVEPKLASCLEIAEWPGGSDAVEAPLFAGAECVTVTGSDQTLAGVRTRLPSHVRMAGYGHRVSFGYVAADALARFAVRKTAQAAAADVVAWDQLGCLSPHVFYVEPGPVSCEAFAAMLAEELSVLETREPRAALQLADAALISSKRAFYEIRAVSSEGTRLWQSENSTAWTVVYEAEPTFQASCLNRFVYVKPVADISMAIRSAEAVRGQVSTVGLAASGEAAQAIATRFARWGVTRICPLGQMQYPPMTWRHDGRPALADLITWTDWEQ